MQTAAIFSPVPAWAPAGPDVDFRPKIADIQRAVARHYAVPLIDMTSARRSKVVARPRQVAMLLAKRLTRRSLPEIGFYFGGRDHTTVMHAVKVTEQRCGDDPDLVRDICILTAQLAPRAVSSSPAHGEI